MSTYCRGLFCLCLLVLVGISTAGAQETETGLTPEQVQKNLESFDIVWTTIYEKHFDTTFGGLDWPALRDSLRPQMEAAASMSDAREILRGLLNSLGLSHFGIIPASLYESIDKPADDDVEAGGSGDGAGVSGISVRVLDGKAVVTDIVADSPADGTGIVPGWEVYIVDGDTIPHLLPPIQEKMAESIALPLYLSSVAATRLRGDVGDTVSVVFRDGDDSEVPLDLVLAEKQGKKVVFGHLPPMYLRTETDTLEHGIGYFHFNCFFDPATLSPAYDAAMRSFLDAPGLIIDVRGNPGGIAGLAVGMAGWLVDQKNLYVGTFSTRETELRMVVNPRPKPFMGPLAILVDGLSGSSAEFFAGGLQDIGRARVFGTRSMGAALPSVIELLPNGDRFQYVLADYVLGSGTPLEGRGVVPDVEVHLTREALLEGDDPVLDAAISWIREQQNNSN